MYPLVYLRLVMMIMEEKDESVVKQSRLFFLFAVRTIYLLTKGTVFSSLFTIILFFICILQSAQFPKISVINCVTTHKNTLQTYGLNINRTTTVKLSTLEHLNISQYYSKKYLF